MPRKSVENLTASVGRSRFCLGYGFLIGPSSSSSSIPTVIIPSTKEGNQRLRDFVPSPSSGMLAGIVAIVLIGLGAWAFQAISPPPPRICGTPGGPPLTATRVQLRDGRHLAYKEYGVPRDTAKYKIVFIHAFATLRLDAVIATSVPPDFLEEHGICVVSYDRPGYGESDPHPKRNERTLALDVEELADRLKLGSKFYVVGYSMGGQAVWGILKHIPHRLAGAALLCPVVNSWWPGLPANVIGPIWDKQAAADLWSLRIAHYTPWLLYWWNTQKFFPSSSVVAADAKNFSPQDLQLASKLARRQAYKDQVTQQGVHESLFRDMMVGFGKWEFDPLELKNPFPKGEGSVHLWQGSEDRLVAVNVSSYIAKKLGWIEYHELPGAGHLFPIADGMSESILKALLFGEH